MTDRDDAIVRLTQTAFDQLDGPDSNLFFDSTSVCRSFRATLGTGVIDAIHIEWSRDEPFHLSDIRLFQDEDSAADAGFKVTSNSTSFETDLPLDVTFNLQMQSADPECSSVRLVCDAANYGSILIERRQFHQPFPRHFRIYTRSTDGTMHCIFDHAKEAFRFFDMLPKQPYLRPFPTVRRQVPAILGVVLRQRYDETRLPFLRFENKFGRDALLKIGETMNTRWLFPRERSFGQHGVKRTFRFWSRKEKAALIKEAHDLTEGLNRHDIKSIVCYGSLLGLIRDKDLIGHDDDLDLLCFNDRKDCSRLTFIAKLAGACAFAGYEILKIDVRYSTIQIMSPTGCKIDLFYCDVDDAGCRFTPSGPTPTQKSVMFPVKTMSFYGQKISVPNKPEALLEDIYGSGWTVPAPVFRHRWTPTT